MVFYYSVFAPSGVVIYHGGLVFCCFFYCPSDVPLQITNYPHFTTAYQASGNTRMHKTATSHTISKHLRLVSSDILNESDNFRGCSKVIPGEVKDSEELTRSIGHYYRDPVSSHPNFGSLRLPLGAVSGRVMCCKAGKASAVRYY